jgi:putative CRISPR-associated protein (TIGR02620 family)
MSKIIVTKHQAALEFLKRMGIHDAAIYRHIDVSLVNEDMTIIGNVPLHLAAKVKDVMAIEFHNLPNNRRNDELTLDDMIQFGAHLKRYKVRRLPVESTNVEHALIQALKHLKAVQGIDSFDDNMIAQVQDTIELFLQSRGIHGE